MGAPLVPPVKGSGLWSVGVAFSRDGKMLASTSGDNSVVLWEVATCKLIGSPLAGHKYPVHTVAFSPDGETLASGSQDATIILWDVKTHLTIGRPLVAHTNEVECVAFSPDGKTLASSGDDHQIYLWDVGLESWRAHARAIANRNLTREEWERYFASEPYQKTCPDLP